MILSDHAPLKSPWEEVVIRIACKSCAPTPASSAKRGEQYEKNSGRIRIWAGQKKQPTSMVRP
jgi:hypothetical protein